VEAGGRQGEPEHEERRMPRAIWNDAVIAEADETVIVEGNHYFPPESVDHRYLRPSERTSICPWKGRASYADVVVDGEVNPAAGWTYPDPTFAAKRIAGHVAFWRGITVEP
jgi:uncharacterized protein (DUF427 family)